MKKIDKRNSVMNYPRVYLYKYRQNINLSAEKIAYSINISPAYYFFLEAGARGNKLSVLLISKLSKVLGIEVQILVENELNYLTEKDEFLKKKQKKLAD